MIPLDNDGEQWMKFKMLSCRTLITYTIWVLVPTFGFFGVMASLMYTSKMTYGNTTLYNDLDILYGMDRGSVDIASLANRAMAPTVWILSYLNPFLVANLLTVSETPVAMNQLTNKKTTFLFCLFFVLKMTGMYIQIVSKKGGITEAVVLGLSYLIMCGYGSFIYIVINIVATDFINASSQLDSIHNTLDLVLKSRQLIEKFRKLKAGMSPLLFIYCICFTVMLLSHAYFMVRNIKNKTLYGGIFYSISTLNVLVGLFLFTGLCGECYKELFRNYERLRLD